jgi:hypothetical protein
VLRINAGGGSYVDSAGDAWQADQAYAFGTWGFTGGQTYKYAVPITGTIDDVLYQSEHYWAEGGSYIIDVPDGLYQVTLKFAEIFYGSYAGSRRFGVRAEDAFVITSFDLFMEAGGRYIALDRQFVIQVMDGQLNLEFVRDIGSPKVNAIEVKWAGP